MPEWYKQPVAAVLDEAAVSHTEGLEALASVRSSQAFGKSPRLCALLEFIVVRSLDGRRDDLTEQQIGIQVFGRTPGYNSAEDTIVRVTARHLRQRLDQYYATEGVADPVRIEVPRGGYVAGLVEARSPSAVEPQVGAQRVPPSTVVKLAARPRPTLVYGLLGTVAVLTVVLAWLGLAFVQLRSTQHGPQPALTGPVPLWQALFTPGRKTLVVPGDASLDAYIAWEQRPVPLEEYTTQQYLRQSTVSAPPTGMDVPLGSRSVTPMADLLLVNTAMRAADRLAASSPVAAQPGQVELRYARDMAVADTHDNNLLLIGSESFNPWVTLYQPQMDFVAHFDFAHDVYRVVNRAPAPGEQPVYEYVRRPGLPQKALTHVALLNNGQGQGRVLIVEGHLHGHNLRRSQLSYAGGAVAARAAAGNRPPRAAARL